MPNQNQDWDPIRQGPPANPRQSFATASITLAVLGIISFFLIITPLVFGSLAIIFALLSRGQNKNVSRPASFAIPLGTIAVLIGVGMLVFGVISIIHQFGSFENYYNLIQQQVQLYYNGDPDALNMNSFMEVFGGQ